jgi:4-diphosphocytidyl-2-C-methyl-D-erythritol kinase
MCAVFQKKLCSPAKINLHLAVGGKRADGFHGIESVFLPVSLYDHIDFQVSLFPPFSVTITGMDGVPLEKNLMYRAACFFHEKTGLAISLRIVIEKNIPSGAGLGGGSSNAAAILRALNEAAGFPVPQRELLDMAARLGSDIPFFIAGKPAVVSGRGETLTPFELRKDIFLVLVKPAFESDTAEAYRLLDAARPRMVFRQGVLPIRSKLSPDGRVLRLSKDRKTPEALIAALEKPPSEWPYYNDFQDVFLDDAYPHSAEYQEIFSSLRDGGARFVSLSGSGSAVFGVYETGNDAIAAAALLKKPFVRQCAAIRCS